MNLQLLLFTLGFCLIQVCTSIYIRTDSSLVKLLLSNRDVSDSNPERSVECFGIYVPQLNAASDKFESDYDECMTNATNKRNLADETTIIQQKQLQDSIESTCADVSRCQNITTSPIDDFNCYEAKGASTAKQMYQVSANAVEYRQNLEIQYTAIEGEQNKCTDATERAYVERTTYIYELLQSCLNGNGPTTQQANTTYLPHTTPNPYTRTTRLTTENTDPENMLIG